MSVKKFKFISPGVFINEIDNSELPATPEGRGPLIIGRTAKGPAMRPIQVDSLAHYVQVFGSPHPGGEGDDVWRNGNRTAPLYAAYAAQAWLTNNSPAVIVNLKGAQHSDATAAGKAGWETFNKTDGEAVTHGGTQAYGGAYGLFMFDSGAHGVTPADGFPSEHPTGTLAAIWYMTNGVVALTGTYREGDSLAVRYGVEGTGLLVASNGDKEFKVSIYGATADTVAETVTFNFDKTSDKYIRNVFNTNPTLTNTAVNSTTKTYWLGETFDRAVYDQCTGSAQWGVILPLADIASTSNEWQNHRYGMQRSSTGWFFSQDVRTTPGTASLAEYGTLDPVKSFTDGQGKGLKSNLLDPLFEPSRMTNLFKIHSLDPGEWNQRNIKISITDIKASTNQSTKYGSFTVEVREIDDTDGSKKVIESYPRCNLNPNSNNFIARRIGDKYNTWDETERRYVEKGNHDNRSDYIYVEVDEGVLLASTDPEKLPFGVYGHPVPSPFAIVSGAHGPVNYQSASNLAPDTQLGIYNASDAGWSTYVTGAFEFYRGSTRYAGLTPASIFVDCGFRTSNKTSLTASISWPSIPLRSGAFDGDTPNQKSTYWGVDLSRKESGTFYTEFEKSNLDILRPLPSSHYSATPTLPFLARSKGATAVATGGGAGENGSMLQYAWLFTLDNLREVEDGAGVIHDSGSRERGISITAMSGTYKSVLSKGYNKFTTVLHGGFDGLDIQEPEPFRNSRFSSPTETTDAPYNSIKRAIDSCKDPEVIDYNLALLPGVTNTQATDHLLKTCESRGDALAIVDLEGGYEAVTENTKSAADRLGSVTNTVDNLENRNLNTSYGCAYYPWVHVRDNANDTTLWVPPSVIALGVMSYSQNQEDLWFAPAGFHRGGLSEGTAGLPVIGVREKLTSDQRDDLYSANINPIASFPNEGIVVFGQKTLQITRSALDRINVRRLMIYVKKEISFMASQVLFDQNNSVTWQRFLAKVEPFLGSVRARFGLDDFKVILDDTTTTPDLKDRNIIYAKIFLKPTRSVEFIAIDFTIMNSGAAFED